jgi:uncharacterized repeat protein (TIGR02543 family)
MLKDGVKDCRYWRFMAFAAIALFAGAGVSVAGVKYVAVVETEIDAQSGAAAELTPAEVRLITAELRREAVKNLPPPAYSIMTTETVIAQGSATLEQCFDENCVIALGTKIGADYIVRGTISKFRARFTLTVEMYETSDGNLVASSEPVRSENIEELIEKASAVCADMYREFAKAQPQAVAVPAPASKPAKAKPKPAPKPPRTPSTSTLAAVSNWLKTRLLPAPPAPAPLASVTPTPAPAPPTPTPLASATPAPATLTPATPAPAPPAAPAPPKQPANYTVTAAANPPLGGTVSRNPAQISYAPGTMVNVMAAPAKDYTFAGWSGDASGNASLVTVTADGDKTLMANFYASVQYTLKATVEPPGGGFILRSPAKKTYDPGEQVKVTAVAADGYGFTGWSGTYEGGRDRLTVAVTMDGNREMTANFGTWRQRSWRQRLKAPDGRGDKTAPPRKPKTGFSLGYGGFTKDEYLAQLGLVHSRPISFSTLSYNIEGNVWVGGSEKIPLKKATNPDGNFLGFNVPVTVLQQLSFFSIEAGVQTGMISGYDATLFNVGLVFGAGVGFSENHSRRYFYRICRGNNYGTHIAGMWWLF